MNGYDDYNTLTRGYLRNYNGFKAALSNLNHELQELQEELKSPLAPISKYGTTIQGVYNELNHIEQEVERRTKVEQRIKVVKYNINKLTYLTTALDRIFQALPYNDMNIIKGYYFQRKSWREVAEQYFLSEKWARQKGARIVKEISDILFYRKRLPPEQGNLFEILLGETNEK